MGRIRDEFDKLGDLGRGATGMVFAARHKTSGRTVAVKALLSTAVQPDVRRRFLREARIQLASPHVVQVLDVRDEDGQIYLIQELVDGSSLEGLLKRGPLALPQALQIAHEVASALAVAHAAGIVHRDVKPANILLTQQGVSKLTDFGIAKMLGKQASISLTATGQGMGTLSYVAPEQAEDAKHVTPAADLYSLGATLYHMLAGRPPFLPGPEIFHQIFEQDPPPLPDLRPDLPRDVDALVYRLMQKHPDDRPPSAAAVVEWLKELAETPRSP